MIVLLLECLDSQVWRGSLIVMVGGNGALGSVANLSNCFVYEHPISLRWKESTSFVPGWSEAYNLFGSKLCRLSITESLSTFHRLIASSDLPRFLQNDRQFVNASLDHVLIRSAPSNQVLHCVQVISKCNNFCSSFELSYCCLITLVSHASGAP